MTNELFCQPTDVLLHLLSDCPRHEVYHRLYFVQEYLKTHEKFAK